MRRILLLTSIAMVGMWPTAAQDTCLAPAMHVDIVGVSSVEDAAGTRSTMLRMIDPNPPARVSGYNIYRSSSAATSPGSWGLIAFNVSDQNAATTEIEWSDESSAVSPTAIFFYRVAAHNGPCDAEGPWVRPSIEDADGDGVADVDDPCPTTPEGVTQLTEGCSATDLLLHPERLVGPVRRGLEGFLAGNSAATPIPDSVLNSVDLAQTALDEVADDLRVVESCMAAETMATVVGHLDDVVLLLQEYLLELLGDGTRATAGWPTPDRGVEGDTDGPYQDPPPEYLYWEGQLFKFMATHEAAMQSSAINDEVCAAQGESMDLSGRVRRIFDRERMVRLDDGRRFVIPWQLVTDGEDLLAEDRPVDVTTTDFGGGIGVATYYQTQVSPFPYIDTSAYDDCLQLRILPVQPLPGSPVPQPGWIRHSPEGYRRTDTVLAVEHRVQLMTEDDGCPGVVPGFGPGGEDVQIEYHYELKLSYQPWSGSWVSQAPLALRVKGDSHPIPLPDMNSLSDATLYATKVKRTCIDGGLTLPVINPNTLEIVGTRPNWQCSSEQVVTSVTETIRVFDPQAFCSAQYSTVLFDIEDHDWTDWRSTTVNATALPVAETPTAVTFSAQGHKIVNGTPTPATVGLHDAFAVYSPFGSIRPGYGTNRQSHLDWPHITGTRNGEAFRYTCSLPKLTTDMVQTCPGDPENFYRMPFPLNAHSHISQGNGGTFSHNGWQWYALDISRFAGSQIRAARGGKVVAIRQNMTLNCQQQTCPDIGSPPGGKRDEYGNYVALQHQDGTVGWYAHMILGSSPLQLDDVVPRGAYLGQMGNSGNSTGPHLHIHVTPEDPVTWGNQTVHIRYEANNLTDSLFQTCMEPQQGKDYSSTNTP